MTKFKETMLRAEILESVYESFEWKVSSVQASLESYTQKANESEDDASREYFLKEVEENEYKLKVLNDVRKAIEKML